MSHPSPGLLESKFQPQLGVRAQVARARLAVLIALTAGHRKGGDRDGTGWLRQERRCWPNGTRIAERPSPRNVCVAWLNLDENDNDPARLLRYLYGALGKCVPILAADAVSEISRTTNLAVMLEGLEPAACRTRTANRTVPRRRTLDHQPGCGAASLEWLLSQAGTQLHVVIGSRQAVGWPQAELRLRGQLLEIDQRALAFNSDEARSFCTHAWRTRSNRRRWRGCLKRPKAGRRRWNC